MIDAPEVHEDNWAELLPTPEAARVLGLETENLRRLEAKHSGKDTAVPVIRMQLDAMQADILGTRVGKIVLYPQPEALKEWYALVSVKESDDLAVVGKATVSPAKFSDTELTKEQERNLGTLTYRLRCETEEVFPRILSANAEELAEVVLATGGDFIKLHLPPVVLDQIRATATSQGVTPAQWIIGLLKMTRGAGLVFLE